MNEPTINITLHGGALDAVFRGLYELPFKEAAPIVADIQAQVKAHNEALSSPADAKP